MRDPGTIRERIFNALIQRYKADGEEALVKIDGLGQKTAETLIEKASVMAKEIEIEYHKKIADQTIKGKDDEKDETRQGIWDASVQILKLQDPVF